MTSEQAAILDSTHWISVSDHGGGNIRVRHPNGAEIRIMNNLTFWSLQSFCKPDLHACIALVPRTGTATDLAQVLLDIDAVAAPQLRLQLARLLDEITLWVFLHPVENTDAWVLNRRDQVVLGFSNDTGEMTRKRLPQDLLARVQALGHVLSHYERMFDTTSPIPLHLPKTAHEALALRARIQET